MLCFVFAALVVILDQFFKQWIVRTIELHGHLDLIPGVIELTHVPNSGAAFNILSDQRWLLAAISFIAAIIFIFILLRYTEGFWGSLGLAAVLGGTVGNLIDRVFQGAVVDMFRPLFWEFAIFNVADIFLTLGFVTFCIHFIVTSIKATKQEELLEEADGDMLEAEADDPYSIYDVPDDRKAPAYDSLSDTKVISRQNKTPSVAAQPVYQDEESSEQSDYSEPAPEQYDYYQAEPEAPETDASAFDALSALESEFGSIPDYDTDDLLREYGFDN